MNHLTLTATKVAARPGKKTDTWSADASHWRCTITRAPSQYSKGGKMTVYYSMGSALKNPPRLAEVLNSLRCDAAAPASFYDFCSELGYDTDSRKAERIWKACRSIAVRLRNLLSEHGEGQYLLKDGEAVTAGHPNELFAYIHHNHSFSWSSALNDQGFSVEPIL